MKEKFVLNKNLFLKSYKGGRSLFSVLDSKGFVISDLLFRLLKRCDGVQTIEEILADFENKHFIYEEILKLREKGILESGYTRTMLANPLNSRHKVKRLAIHITSCCNLDCMHCYISDFDDLQFEMIEIEELIQSMIRMNVFDLSITGGEPFLCSDTIKKFSNDCFKHGIRIENIFTNGTLLKKHIPLLQELKQRFNTLFYVSIDGLNGTYDSFRRKVGAFKNLEEGLHILNDNGLRIIANIFIHKENSGELVDIYRFLKQFSTLHRIRLNSGFYLGNWKTNVDEYGVALEKEIAVIKELITVWEKDGKNYELEYGHLFRYLYGKKLNLDEMNYTVNSLCCEYYKDYMFIFPNGDVTPCGITWPHYVCGNIKEASLETIWGNEKMRQFKELTIKDIELEQCNSCEHLARCGAGCRGNAMLTGHGLKGLDEDICYLFKSNAYQCFL